MVAYLHEQYLQGIYEVSVASIIADLDLAEGTRIDKLFNGSPAWNRLLTLRTGMCTFSWPAVAADGNCHEVGALT